MNEPVTLCFEQELALALSSVCKMPFWIAAEFTSGKTDTAAELLGARHE